MKMNIYSRKYFPYLFFYFVLLRQKKQYRCYFIKMRWIDCSHKHVWASNDYKNIQTTSHKKLYTFFAYCTFKTKRSKTQPWFHFVLLDKLSEKTESINLLKTMETKPRSFIALRFHCIIEPAKIFVIVFAVLCWKLNTKD